MLNKNSIEIGKDSSSTFRIKKLEPTELVKIYSEKLGKLCKLKSIVRQRPREIPNDITLPNINVGRKFETHGNNSKL